MGSKRFPMFGAVIIDLNAMVVRFAVIHVTLLCIVVSFLTGFDSTLRCVF